MKKRSVTIARHATSITLEAEFWDVLKTIAEKRELSLNALIAEVDEARAIKSPESNLSSSIRVYVLKELLKDPL